ncbi:MAG: hypothetical protein JWM86_2478, partial [Thermoleophilia bacterium]|nr:hypothetical protein [Thermoleophilia bacterium]
LQDCDPLQQLNELEPADAGSQDSGASSTDPLAQGSDSAQPGIADGSSEQIPQLGDQNPDAAAGGFEDPAAALPSTEPGSGGGDGTVTVDQDGNICPSDGAAATDPLDTTATADTTGSTSSTASTGATTGTTSTTSTNASGGWPAGKAGWTVVVAGYPTASANAQGRAQERAQDLQDDGFTDGGVLLSDEYKSLCPGFYVAYSGVFETERAAKARKSELAAKDPSTYVNVYPREIKANGTPQGECTSAN